MGDLINARQNNIKLKLAPSFAMGQMHELFPLGLDELMNLEIDKDPPIVDGILFYHKEAPYISGTTPLVGWLKPEHMTEQFLTLKLHPVGIIYI